MHDRLPYLVKMEYQGPYLFPAPNNQKSYKIYEIIVQDTGHLATKNSGSAEKENQQIMYLQNCPSLQSGKRCPGLKNRKSSLYAEINEIPVLNKQR